MIELNFQKKKSCSGVILPKFCEKWMWVIFCMKLQHHEVLKLTEIIFLTKILPRGFWANGDKMKFMEVMKN